MQIEVSEVIRILKEIVNLLVQARYSDLVHRESGKLWGNNIIENIMEDYFQNTPLGLVHSPKEAYEEEELKQRWIEYDNQEEVYVDFLLWQTDAKGNLSQSDLSLMLDINSRKNSFKIRDIKVA